MTKEELLAKWGEPTKVGTDGHVRLVDCMGTDAAVVQAARVSYGAGTKTSREDSGLIRYLMKHHHSTPFEMCEIKLHVRVPMDIWRQWIRHRTASVNECSTRYSEAIDAQNTTEPGEWRMQSKNNKQGSAGLLMDSKGSSHGPQDWANGPARAYELTGLEAQAIKSTKWAYNAALKEGVAREQARKILPLSTYTEAYWKIDLKNLMGFLQLRLHPHAQQEIREFAQVIYEIVKDWVPMVADAFEEYRLGGCSFSASEMKVLRAVLAGDLANPNGLDEIVQGLPQMTFKNEVNQYLRNNEDRLTRTIFKLKDQDRVRYLEKHGLTNKRERIEFFKKIKEPE